MRHLERHQSWAVGDVARSTSTPRAVKVPAPACSKGENVRPNTPSWSIHPRGWGDQGERGTGQIERSAPVEAPRHPPKIFFFFFSRGGGAPNRFFPLWVFFFSGGGARSVSCLSRPFARCFLHRRRDQWDIAILVGGFVHPVHLADSLGHGHAAQSAAIDGQQDHRR